MTSLYIIRGLPGAGKTTLGNRLKACDLVRWVVSADDFMTNSDGDYLFDPTRLSECHAKCLSVVKSRLASGESVAVCNTFTRTWEVEPYVRTAKANGCSVFVIRCEGAFQNIHGVPESTVANMRDRFEDWTGPEEDLK